MHALFNILSETWALVMQSSLYLLVGFLLAGVLHALLPAGRLAEWLGPRRWVSVVRAALIGTPLPLCSCAVVPVASTLRRRGASKGATTAFLISTPESGVESIALTYALMDPAMTIARPLSAFATALAAGVAQNAVERDEPLDDNESDTTASCAGGGDADQEPPQTRSLGTRVRETLRYAFVDMFEDLGVYLAGGFLLAGVLTVLLQEFDPIRAALASAWAPLLMLAAGVPMYVCAAAATPMIAVLVSEGLSPGAGLVFLLAGPATNAATIVLLMKILGRRAVVVYLVAIMVCALGFGFLLDATYGWIGMQPVMLTRADACCTQPSVIDMSAAFVLLALTATGISRVIAKRLSGY